MRRATFSIVVPVHDRENLVIRCLDSIHAQTYRPLHLVVADNNSSDNTLSNVMSWKGNHESGDFKVTVVSETVPGATAARNRGLAEVDSEWVTFFDSDDEMNPDMIQSVVDAIDKADNPGKHPRLIFWQTAFVNSDGSLTPRRFSRHHLLRRHIINGLLATQSFAVRTGFLRKCGSWNVSLPCWNDWELGLRLLLANPATICIPRILCRIYPQAQSITGLNFHSRYGEWEKSIQAMEKECSSLPSPRKERLLRLLLYRRVILAAHYAREGRDDLGRRLLDESLRLYNPSPWRKALLKSIYHYTRLGGRAAYLIWH